MHGRRRTWAPHDRFVMRYQRLAPAKAATMNPAGRQVRSLVQKSSPTRTTNGTRMALDPSQVAIFIVAVTHATRCSTMKPITRGSVRA